MRFATPVALGLMTTMLLAGCAGDDGEPLLGAAEPVPRLVITGFNYEDQWCDDDVPVRFVVGAEGQGIARSVHVTVSGGYQNAEQTLGDIAAGEARNVSLVIRADDSCGSSDFYNVVVTARSSNAGTQSSVAQIDI